MRRNNKNCLRKIQSHGWEKTIAECQSRWPDIPIKIVAPHFSSVKESIVVLGAVFLLSQDKYWESTEIIQRIGKLCYQHRYQDGWENVQEILERASNWQEYQVVVKLFMSENDYYGNYLKSIEKMVKRLEARPDISQKLGEKVHYPQRKRGYRDKGTLRRPHQRHGEDISDTIPYVDRRGFIKHPLLGDIKTQGEFGSADSSPKSNEKGSEQDDFLNRRYENLPKDAGSNRKFEAS